MVKTQRQRRLYPTLPAAMRAGDILYTIGCGPCEIVAIAPLAVRSDPDLNVPPTPHEHVYEAILRAPGQTKPLTMRLLGVQQYLVHPAG